MSGSMAFKSYPTVDPTRPHSAHTPPTHYTRRTSDEYRKLKTELIALGVPNAESGFPRTHIRSSLGLSLTEKEISARAAALDAWLKQMIKLNT